MVWDSIGMMTVIDVLIIMATAATTRQFFVNKAVLKKLDAIRPVVLVLFGLFIIALFYAADLVTMYIFPWFMPMERAMMLMKDLHLNLKWIVALVGVGFIVGGLFYLIKNLFPKIIAIQNALIEKESYLDSILQSSLNQAIIASDLNFTIKYYNTVAEEFFGYAQKDVIGRSVLEMHGRENVDPRRFEAGIEAVRISGEHTYSSQIGEGKRGFFLETRVSGILDREGERIGYVLNAQDMTRHHVMIQSLHDALDAAEAASKAKSSFLATVSHEIRTPMNAILGMAESLEDTDLNEEQRSYVRLFEKAGHTLLALINDILDLAKIESNQLELEAVDFDLEETVRKVVQIFQGSAGEKGLELIYDISPEIPRQLVGDALRLHQILSNLVSNAIKFTEGGFVRIDMRQGERRGPILSVKFSVTDTGMGVAHDKQGMIFSAFSQADVSTTRKFGGTGLGLTICNKLVGLMGGKLTLASEPGEGSCFSFTANFTVQNRAAAQIPTESCQIRYEGDKKSRARRSVRPLHILLVDDSDENLFVLRAFLKKEPHDVATAKNGVEALEKMTTSVYDMVFMDMQMPVMDGYTATRKFRLWEQEHHREPTTIIALSGFAMKDDITETIEAGCDLHLSKPIRKQCLLDTIINCS